jgi:hypothetical protein
MVETRLAFVIQKFLLEAILVFAFVRTVCSQLPSKLITFFLIPQT